MRPNYKKPPSNCLHGKGENKKGKTLKTRSIDNDFFFKARRVYAKNKNTAIEKQEELKTKLTEIHSKLEEIDQKASDINKNSSDPESVETFLSDYKQKIDQLEILIANLTMTEMPKSTADAEDFAAKNQEASEQTWTRLINSKLKRAKDIISKINMAVGSSTRPVATITKYLPTSKIFVCILLFIICICFCIFVFVCLVVTKTIIQYQPTGNYEDDNNYQNNDIDKDDLLTQATEIETHLKDPQIFGPDSVFLPLRDQCFTGEDGG